MVVSLQPEVWYYVSSAAILVYRVKVASYACGRALAVAARARTLASFMAMVLRLTVFARRWRFRTGNCDASEVQRCFSVESISGSMEVFITNFLLPWDGHEGK